MNTPQSGVETAENVNQKLTAELITLAVSPSHQIYTERVPVTLSTPFENKTVISLNEWLIQATLGNVLPVSPISVALSTPEKAEELVESPFFDRKTLNKLADLAIETGLFSTSVDVGKSAIDIVVENPDKIDNANVFRDKFLETFKEHYNKEGDPDPISVRLIELAKILKTNGYK